MVLAVPETAREAGFRNAPIGGAHTGRTMMLAELRRLMAACPAESDVADYRTSIIQDNVLLKPTVATRRASFERLRQFYALSPSVLLFRALRDLWLSDDAEQPLLAALCANARDPVFRGTADLILATSPGDAITWQQFAAATGHDWPDRYNRTTLTAIGQHVASSWQQAGHLTGQNPKTRAQAKNGPGSLAYALLLGYLCGVRGEALFTTLWCRLLDAPAYVLHKQAIAASRLGWIEYRSAGGIVEVGFRFLLRGEEVPA